MDKGGSLPPRGTCCGEVGRALPRHERVGRAGRRGSGGGGQQGGGEGRAAGHGSRARGGGAGRED